MNASHKVLPELLESNQLFTHLPLGNNQYFTKVLLVPQESNEFFTQNAACAAETATTCSKLELAVLLECN